MSVGALLRVHCVRLAVVGLGLVLVPVSESAAQAEWQRTVKVIAPIQEGMVTSALLDSVVSMAEAEGLQFRRSPQSDTTATAEELKAALSPDGLALSSASHVFITYQFTLRDSGFHRDILDLYFIYRPSAEQGQDIPILYLDLTKDELYRKVLVERGTPSPVNEVVFRSFEEQIRFINLREEATVVQVGNEIIRDSARAASEKRQLMETIRKLATY